MAREWLYESHLAGLREELAIVTEHAQKLAAIATHTQPAIISATHAMVVAKGKAYCAVQQVIEQQIAMAEDLRAQWEQSNVDPSK